MDYEAGNAAVRNCVRQSPSEQNPSVCLWNQLQNPVHLQHVDLRGFDAADRELTNQMLVAVANKLNSGSGGEYAVQNGCWFECMP